MAILRKQSNRSGRMFWGCFSFYGKGACVTCPETIKKEQYKELIDTYLLDDILLLRETCDPYLLQDNARAHDNKFVYNYFLDNDIKWLNWPPCSPDLNPIEDVWAIIKARTNKKGIPANLAEIEDIFLQEWEKFSESTLKSLAMSFEGRLRRVVELDGELINKFYL